MGDVADVADDSEVVPAEENSAIPMGPGKPTLLYPRTLARSEGRQRGDRRRTLPNPTP